MRLNPKKQKLTAQEILNYWPKKKLIEIFKKYGEEKFSRLIANKIFKERQRRKIETTGQLVKIIGGLQMKRKVLARIFQALRIVINNELENLERALPQAIEVLSPGGRLVVISYHSLEDRIVKNFMKGNSRIKILTKKPLRPTKEEIEKNPRARSAKLRAAEKI